MSINPLVLWAWTGLIINAVNSIPTGELDGGRISFAIWGRKVNSVSIHALVGVIPIVMVVLTALRSSLLWHRDTTLAKISSFSQTLEK